MAIFPPALYYLFLSDGVCYHLLYDLVPEYDDQVDRPCINTKPYRTSRQGNLFECSFTEPVMYCHRWNPTLIYGGPTGAKDCESSGADHERQFFGADPAY